MSAQNPNTADLRTKLKKVKGLGPSHHGLGHWWMQRLTAVALIPLSLWVTSALVTVMLSPNVVKVATWFASPLNAVIMVMFLIAGFIHAKLGVQVIVEDYVHKPVTKYTLLILNSFICYAFAAISVLAVLKLHFLDVGSNV